VPVSAGGRPEEAGVCDGDGDLLLLAAAEEEEEALIDAFTGEPIGDGAATTICVGACAEWVVDGEVFPTTVCVAAGLSSRQPAMAPRARITMRPKANRVLMCTVPPRTRCCPGWTRRGV
jgi:hypothetical protein